MKKLFFALTFFFAFTGFAEAQCNGVFANNTVCGNATGSSNTPRPTNPSAFLGAAGGTNGQIQYNNSGALGGFTAGQDATINTATGAVNVTKLQNIPATATGAATNDVWYFNGTGWLHNAFLTLLNTVCTATPGTCSSIFGYVNIIWYGAVCDGSTADTTAIQNAINASAGRVLLIPPSASGCVVAATITLVANTTLRGTGWNSIIKSTVVNTPTFSATDISNVVLDNFAIAGTNNSSGWASASNFGPLQIIDSAAVSAITNIQFTRMKLTGFNSTYWVYISIANTATVGIQDVKFDDNYIVTDSSNIPSDAAPQNNNNYGFVFFSGTTQSMRRASFSRNKIASTGMCFPIIMFGNVSFANLDENEIDSPGQTSSTHCDNAGATTINAYGVAVYDLYGNGNTANTYTIANNVINSPYSSGIYLVGNSNTDCNAAITGNSINGQTSTDNATLPRGAIVSNGCSGITISGNSMSNGFAGIAIAAISANVINITGNKCYTANGSASSYCYRQTPATGASNTETVNLIGNAFFTNNTATTVLLSASTVSNKFTNVTLIGNQIRSAASGTGINGASQFFSDQLALSGNTFSGAGTAASLGSITGNLALNSNPGLSFTAATLPATVNGSNVFVSDGAPASSPCTGTSTGSTAFRQNSAWKCF